MPRYEITAPDGRRFEITAPEGATQDQILAYAQANYAAATPNPEGGFIHAVKAGVSGLKEAGYALAGRAGIMDEAAAEKAIEAEKQYQQRTFAPTSEGWTESPWTKFKETLGQSLPYMAAPAVAGVGAAALPLTGTAATIAGMGAAGLASTGQFTATNLARQIEEGKRLSETELGPAVAAAIPQAALDIIGFKMIPGIRQIFNRAGKDISKDAAAAMARQGTINVLKDYAAATGKAVGAEGITEAAQQFLERMQAGLSLTDEKARNEYWDSLIGGAVLGGALAPAGRYIERGAEQAKAKEVAQQKQQAAAEAERTAYETPTPAQLAEFDAAQVVRQRGLAMQGLESTAPVGPLQQIETRPPEYTAAQLGMEYAQPGETLDMFAGMQATPTPAVAPEAEIITPALAYPTVLTPQMLANTGLKPQSKFFSRLVGKDLSDEAQQKQVADVLMEVRSNPELVETTKQGIEKVAMQAFGALAIQQEMFGPRGGVLTQEPKRRPRVPKVEEEVPSPPAFEEPKYAPGQAVGAEGITEAAPVPRGITKEDITATGMAAKTAQRWLNENVVGKSVEELQQMVAAQPDLLKGKGSRASVLNALLEQQATTIPAFEEPKYAPGQLAPIEQRGGVPSVGVSGEPIGVGLGAAPTGELAAPVGRGVVPAGPDVSQTTGITPTTFDTLTQPTETQRAAETTETPLPAVQEEARQGPDLSERPVNSRVKPDEPPLAEGMTRLYHGSAQHGRYDGKAWFSTDRNYAANYRDGAELQYVDVPTERINKLTDPDNYGQTPDKGFTFNGEFDSADVGERKPLLPKPKTEKEAKELRNGTQAPETPLPAVQEKAQPKQPVPEEEVTAQPALPRVDDEPGIRTALQAIVDDPKADRKVKRVAAASLADIDDNAGKKTRLAGSLQLAHEWLARQQRKVGAGETAFSEGRAQYTEGSTTNPTTVDKIKSAIKSAFFSPARMDAVVTVLPTQEAAVKLGIPDVAQASQRGSKIKGFTHGDKVYLIAENIPAGQEMGVFLHEVGVHLGMEKLVGKANMEWLAGKVEEWAKKDDGSVESRIAKQAVERAANSSSENKQEELIAYMVEGLVNEGINPQAAGTSQAHQWFRKLWAAAKAALRKLGFKNPNFSGQNLVDLAYGAADLELEGAWHGTAADFRKFNHEYMGSGEGTQAYGWGTYLAQKVGIAKEYWKAGIARKVERRTTGDPTVDRFLALMDDAAANGKAVTQEYMRITADNLPAAFDRALPKIKAFIDAHPEGLPAQPRQEGSLMRVAANVREDEMLNLDEDYTKQSKTVQQALDKIKQRLEDSGMLGTYEEAKNADFEEWSGKELVKQIIPRMVKDDVIPYSKEIDDAIAAGNVPKAVSMYLDSLGIKGNKFLDARSRKGRTFVVSPKGEVLSQQTTAYRPAYTALTFVNGFSTFDEAIAEAVKQGETHPAMEDVAEVLRRWKKQGYTLRNEEQTRNLVIFNDKNLVRASTQVGASRDSDKIKFSLSPQTMSMLRDDIKTQESQPGMKDALKQAYNEKGFSGALAYSISEGVADLRTVLSNKLATVQDRLAKQYTNSVRDEFGKLSPLGKLLSAEASGQLTNQYFRDGYLAINPKTGRFETVTAPGKAAPGHVPNMVQQWGEANGMAFNEAWNLANFILQGVRIKEMRLAGVSPDEFYSHMDPAKIDQYYNEYKNDPLLQKISAAMDEPRIALVDWMVKVGRLTPEMGDAWKAVAGYVPFDRVDDLDAHLRNPQKKIGRGIAQLGELPRSKGSETRPVKNVFENYFSTMEWMLRTVVQQDATLSTLRELEKLGVAKYLGKNEALVTSRNKTVDTYIGGQKAFFELPTNADVAAFNDRSSPVMGIMKVFSEFSRVLRTAITAIPTFTAKQIPEDIQRAIMHSGVKNVAGLTTKVLSDFKDLTVAIAQGRQHPIMEKMGRKGIFGEIDFRLDNPGQSYMQDIGLVKRNFLGSERLGKLLHKAEMIAQASDLALRNAVYEHTLTETKDEALALYRAQEIINFRHRGAGDRFGVLNAMLQTVPFFNAYVQSMDVTLRSLTGKNAVSGMAREQALKMFWSRAAIASSIGIMYALGNADDDTYDNMDQRSKDSVWYLGKVNGVPVGLPAPMELGLIFKSIPERVVEYYRFKGTPEERAAMEGIKTWFTAAIDTYGGRVVPIPLAARPVLESIMNHSFFTGREIVGAHMKDIEPYLQQVETTSELAKNIAEYTHSMTGGTVNISPLHVDNVLRGYFGTTASMIMMATNAALNPDRLDTPLHKMVGLGVFTYDPIGRRNVSDFYDTYSKVSETQKSFNELAKRDPDAAYKYMEQNTEKLAVSKLMAKTLDELSKLREIKNALRSPNAAQTMPKEERQRMYDEISKYETEITKYIHTIKAQYNL